MVAENASNGTWEQILIARKLRTMQESFSMSQFKFTRKKTALLVIYIFFFVTESRYVLLPMIVEQLKHEINKSEEMKSCIDIMNDILIILTRNDVVS